MSPIRSRRTRNLLMVIAVIAVVILCGGSLIYAKFFKSQPPKKEDLPPLAVNLEADFIDEKWKKAEIDLICLDGDISWPANQHNSPSLDILKDLLSVMGYTALIGNSGNCDVSLSLQASGKPLAARYSWAYGGNAKNCLTGYDFQTEFLLSSAGLPDLQFSDSKNQAPPDTVDESRCETAYQNGLGAAWRSFLNKTLTGIWGNSALIAVEQVLPLNTMGVCERGLHDAQIEYLDLYIQDMMDSERFPDTFCIERLGNLGEQAEKAVPYLLYLLDTIDDEHGEFEEEMVFKALRAITGEQMDDNANKWWGWWEEQQRLRE